MISLLSIIPLTLPSLTLISATPEILHRNLAYKSPYISDPSLSIDVQEVHKRHLAARDEIRSELRKRQITTVPKGQGEPQAYPEKGYGLGVVDWTDAEYIYSGDLNFTHSVASGMF